MTPNPGLPANPTPAAGQVWIDRDRRVSHQLVLILRVLPDGRVHVARGRDGSGTESKIQIRNLHRRFTYDPTGGR